MTLEKMEHNSVLLKTYNDMIAMLECRMCPMAHQIFHAMYPALLGEHDNEGDVLTHLTHSIKHTKDWNATDVKRVATPWKGESEKVMKLVNCASACSVKMKHQTQVLRVTQLKLDATFPEVLHVFLSEAARAIIGSKDLGCVTDEDDMELSNLLKERGVVDSALTAIFETSISDVLVSGMQEDGEDVEEEESRLEQLEEKRLKLERERSREMEALEELEDRRRQRLQEFDRMEQELQDKHKETREQIERDLEDLIRKRDDIEKRRMDEHRTLVNLEIKKIDAIKKNAIIEEETRVLQASLSRTKSQLESELARADAERLSHSSDVIKTVKVPTREVALERDEEEQEETPEDRMRQL